MNDMSGGSGSQIHLQALQGVVRAINALNTTLGTAVAAPAGSLFGGAVSGSPAPGTFKTSITLGIAGTPGSLGIGGTPFQAGIELAMYAQSPLLNGGGDLTGIPGTVYEHTVGPTATKWTRVCDSIAEQNGLIYRRANGTVAVPTALNKDDVILNLTCRGYDGSEYTSGSHGSAAMEGRAAENWTPTAISGYWTFRTADPGTTNGFFRMRIGQGVSIDDISENSSPSLFVDPGAGGLRIGGSSAIGFLQLVGNSSGVVTVQPQSAAGTFNFNLPITAGALGQVLTSGGGVGTAMTWSAPANQVSYLLKGVNFNVGTTDTTISITLPAGTTRYQVVNVVLSNASHSLTTATCGLFTAAGGSGTICADQAIGVSTSADGTVNNSQSLVVTNATSTTYTVAGFGTLYFRVGTPEGAAATGDVTISLRPIS